MRLSKYFLAVALIGFAGSVVRPLRAQDAAKPAERQWKDRAEYDLYQAASTATDPSAAVAKLDQWKKQYPDSQFKSVRELLFLEDYAKLGKIQDAVAEAKEILATDPNNFRALYYLTLYTPARVQAGATSVPPDVLDDGEKAATGMLANLDKQKPANMSDAQWEAAKKPIAAVAHQTLGWVAMQRKDYAKAETEFKQSLALNPNNGDVDYYTGVVEAAQKDVNKIPDLLFYFARAANYSGPGAASAGYKTAAANYLDKAYANYHGSKDGEDKLIAMATANGAPPADYHLESIVDIEKKKVDAENALAKDNPELAVWLNIHDLLTAADGQTYFDQNMKGKALPKLKGKVVSLEPATNPKTIVMSLGKDGTTPDATLKLKTPLPGKVDPGTELTFERAVAESFTADPFMVTMTVEEPKDQITGWTGKAAPVVHHRPPVKH